MIVALSEKVRAQLVTLDLAKRSQNEQDEIKYTHQALNQLLGLRDVDDVSVEK